MWPLLQFTGFVDFFALLDPASQVKGLHCPRQCWCVRVVACQGAYLYLAKQVHRFAATFLIIFINDWPPSIWRQFSVDNVAGANKEFRLIRYDFKDR